MIINIITVVPLSSFSQEYTLCATGGGEEQGVNARRLLLKNVDYDPLHFHTGSLKLKIFKVLLIGMERVTKRVLCVRF